MIYFDLMIFKLFNIYLLGAYEMKKILIILLLIILILNISCNLFVKRPFTPKDYLGITWISDDNNIQFTFDDSKVLDGFGNIISESDNIPILVLFSRSNYLTIIDEKKYNDTNNVRESKILDGTVKLKKNMLILKVLHNRILDKEYEAITFMQQN